MSDPNDPCVFCEPHKYVEDYYDLHEYFNGYSMYIATPINPVVPNHQLVIPFIHRESALEDPRLTGAVMTAACRVAAAAAKEHGDEEWNIITSVGPNATQSVRHLHIHLVPRREGDGLTLPWTNQQITGENA